MSRYLLSLKLNAAQRNAVAWYFSPENDSDPWPEDEPIRIGVYNDKLVLNGCWLDGDGEWNVLPVSGT